jgi:hypothetical protein
MFQDLWSPSNCGPKLNVVKIKENNKFVKMLSEEATNINFIIYSLTRLGLEPTIYCTRGEHANHYASDAVVKF